MEAKLEFKPENFWDKRLVLQLALGAVILVGSLIGVVWFPSVPLLQGLFYLFAGFGLGLVADAFLRAEDRKESNKERNQVVRQHNELMREFHIVKTAPIVERQCSAWMLGYYMIMSVNGVGPVVMGIDILERACLYARVLGIGDENLYAFIRGLPQLARDQTPADPQTMLTTLELQIGSRLVDPLLRRCYDCAFNLGLLFFGVRQNLGQDKLAIFHAKVLQLVTQLKDSGVTEILAAALSQLQPKIGTLSAFESNLKPVTSILESVGDSLERFKGELAESP